MLRDASQPTNKTCVELLPLTDVTSFFNIVACPHYTISFNLPVSTYQLVYHQTTSSTSHSNCRSSQTQSLLPNNCHLSTHIRHRTPVVTFRLGRVVVQVLNTEFQWSVGLVEDVVSLGQFTVRVIRFSPSLELYHRSTLISMFLFLLPVGQAGEIWETSFLYRKFVRVL
jgi:hypothetical protein